MIVGDRSWSDKKLKKMLLVEKTWRSKVVHVTRYSSENNPRDDGSGMSGYNNRPSR